MGDFKIGDRVWHPLAGAEVLAGTVHGRWAEDSNFWAVQWDGLGTPSVVAEAELKLVDQPTPDLVSHPPHYTEGTPAGVEVIDIIRAHEAAGGTWETLNAVKYILRHTLKDNPVQDIKKAIQYLTMWVERQEAA